jgi:4-hydroxy-3-methylbut-2-enyl diphosphate reductase
VDRAIQIVEAALKKFGAPVYVRHEIVHNKYVVDGLKAKGAVFVEELDEVPEGAPVVFSAHGVPKSVPAEAARRNMIAVDATCPLVSKVHRDAERHYREGREVILIGHAGHPEVVGTMGQLPKGAVHLVEEEKDIFSLKTKNPLALAYCTQTTLSVDDTAKIVATLIARFPAIQGPKKQDICYATTNRQAAVRKIAEWADVVLVLGAPNSSNSRRLAETAQQSGCEKSLLIQRASEIDWDWLGQPDTLGITAGASAPEVLVDEVLEALKKRFDVTVEEVRVAEENIAFNIPAILREEEAA